MSTISRRCCGSTVPSEGVNITNAVSTTISTTTATTLKAARTSSTPIVFKGFRGTGGSAGSELREFVGGKGVSFPWGWFKNHHTLYTACGQAQGLHPVPPQPTIAQTRRLADDREVEFP